MEETSTQNINNQETETPVVANTSKVTRRLIIFLVLFVITGIAGTTYFLTKKSLPPSVSNSQMTPLVSVVDEEKIENTSVVGSWNSYYLEDNTVYFDGKKVFGADITTFQELEYGYGKDQNAVYLDGKVLTIDVNPTAFVVVSRNVVKDNSRVYFRDYYEDTYYLATGVDALTFEYVGSCAAVERSGSGYYRDKNYLFTQSSVEGTPVVPVNEADISSFQYLGMYAVAEGMPYAIAYAKDKNHVYHSCGEILEGADVFTFTDLKDGYAKDENNVWYLADLITSADVATFESLGGGYAKDSKQVYFAGAVLQNADPTTFTLVYEDAILTEDGFTYAKDVHNVYSWGQIIQGVDPENCIVESIENCKATP